MAMEPTQPVLARPRRAVLIGALGGLAAAVGSVLGRPSAANASAGDPLVIGQSNDAFTSQTVLVSQAPGATFTLRDSANSGTGIFGWSSGTDGTGRGLYGRADSPHGDGVQARNTGAVGDGAALRAIGVNNTAVIAEGSPTGVFGTGSTYGVHGESVSNYGVFGNGGYTGVYGTGPYGVYGVGTSAGAIGTSSAGYGLYGLGSIGAVGIGSGNGYGMWGYNADSGGYGAVGQGGYRGVYGSGGNAGVYGTSGYVGVWGNASSTEGLNFGVYAYSGSSGGYAGVFSGAVQVSGFLSKLGGGFKIDHPQDPDNRYLVHSFVEAPEMLNVYNGTVRLDAGGRATVQLPAYFGAENRDHRYQLTAIGGAAPDLHVAQRVANNQFKIAGGSAGLEVSWLVTGVRQDAWAKANPMEVEPLKAADDKRRYLAPSAHGKPASAGIYALEHRLPASGAAVDRVPENLAAPRA